MASLLQSKVFLDSINQWLGDFFRTVEWKYRAIAVELDMQMATFARRKFRPLLFQPPLELAVLHGTDAALLMAQTINT